MSRRARRALRRLRIRIALGLLFAVLVVGLAALTGGAGNDPYLDSARAAVFPLALLAAYVAGSLVASQRRRRT